ncbi:hypothetical protein [Burkholderia anthina]|uniref:DUF7940 domain-containing protein n=1 Tax=Burkholderia anthina TaxID=179879 RepID=UPI00158A1F37|nr:hypothetical protein [Burkholderia anthina]
MHFSLSDEWAKAHKKVTFWLSAGLASMSAMGPVIREAWHAMPDDLKAVVPAHVQQAIAYAILFLTIVGAHYVAVGRAAPASVSDQSGGQQ